ncbi:MAG: hypothetical protein ACRDIU_01975 [Actinomycetota bacterium]
MRGLLGDLISKDAQFTIADMEAGLEHLSRSDGTLRHIDMLLVVLEPYRKALETARRTLALAGDLGIPKIYGVGSKIRDEVEAEEVKRFAGELGLPLIGVIPYDDNVRLADREGSAVIDLSPETEAVKAVEQLLDSLESAVVPA